MTFRAEDGKFLRKPERVDFGLEEPPVFRLERSDDERKGLNLT
jgi:hypothetical protein